VAAFRLPPVEKCQVNGLLVEPDLVVLLLTCHASSCPSFPARTTTFIACDQSRPRDQEGFHRVRVPDGNIPKRTTAELYRADGRDPERLVRPTPIGSRPTRRRAVERIRSLTPGQRPPTPATQFGAGRRAHMPEARTRASSMRAVRARAAASSRAPGRTTAARNLCRRRVSATP
jgi:hypothetical protein